MHKLQRSFPHLMTDEQATRALAAVGIPSTFPIETCKFPQRIATLAETYGLNDVRDLCTLGKVFANLGPSSKVKNFGRRSVPLVAGFQQALAAGNLKELQQYLPISASRGGIDFGVACAHAAQKTVLGVKGLAQRLVTDDTLEKVGQDFGITKQRVQQVEDLFLISLTAVLDARPAEKNLLWREWTRHGRLDSLETNVPEDVRTLTRASIAEIFKRSPEGREQRAAQFQGAAAIAGQVSRQIAVFEQGLKLTEFLQQYAPEVSLHQFRAWNEITERFILSPDGTARMEAPKAKEVVAALLEAQVRRPKNILDYLMTVPGLRSWPTTSLAQNCLDWAAGGNFPATSLLGDDEEFRPSLPKDEPLTTDSLIAFVRHYGRLRLTTAGGQSTMAAEIHSHGLVFVTAQGTSRFCDTKALEHHVEVYRKTKSLVTTAYSKHGLQHSTYFIALVRAHQAASTVDAEAAKEIAEINAAKATEKTAIYLSRIGQGRFREDVIKHRRQCYVTGLQDSKFLRASHIKPWCDSDNEHRLDWHNGLLLSPNYDHLFDRGLISFEDDGRILISPLIPAAVLKSFGIKSDFAGEPFCERTRKFIAIHRTEHFRRK